MTDITAKQRANLAKLAAYLEKLPEDYERFDMKSFNNKGSNYDTPIKVQCGSAGCAVGHGPNAGIPTNNDATWWAYAERVFLPTAEDGFWWMFDGEWVGVDNTPQGAAKRIHLFLDGAVPENWDEQLNGEAGLIY